MAVAIEATQTTQQRRSKNAIKGIRACAGDEGPNVERLQAYLKKFGYLESPVLDTFGTREDALAEESPGPGRYDESTKRAVERFQEFASIPVSGQLDEPTITMVTVSEPAKEVLRKRVGSFEAMLTGNSEILSAPIEEKRIFLRLRNLELESLQGTGFDVHVTDNPQGPVSRSDVSFVGSIKLFNHPPGHRHNLSASRSRGRASRTPMQESNSQTFDVTKALAATKSENLAGLSVVLIPYSLVSSADREVVSLGTNAMKVGNIEFFVR